MILTNETASALIGHNHVSDRILNVCTKAKPYNLSIIKCYAPTSTAGEEGLDEFYSQLQETLVGIPHRDKNCHWRYECQVVSSITGTSTYGIYGIGIRSERGESLIELCETLSWQMLRPNTIQDACILGHQQRVQQETRLTI